MQEIFFRQNHYAFQSHWPRLALAFLLIGFCLGCVQDEVATPLEPSPGVKEQLSSEIEPGSGFGNLESPVDSKSPSQNLNELNLSSSGLVEPKNSDSVATQLQENVASPGNDEPFADSSTIAGDQTNELEDSWRIKRGDEVQKCYFPAADIQSEADQARAAQALLMVIEWKHRNKLLDVRPEGEAEAIMKTVASISPVKADQTVTAQKRDVLSSIENVLIRKGVEKTQSALDPKKILKDSFEIFDLVLSNSKDAIGNSALATRVEKTIQEDTSKIVELFKEEMKEAKLGNADNARNLSRRRDAVVRHRAGAYAVRNDINRSVNSIERNMGRLKRFKQAVNIIDAVGDSKNPNYASGVASSVYSVIKDWKDSKVVEAQKLLEVKGLDAKKAFDFYEQKHFDKRRGQVVRYRGNLFGRMCQRGKDWVAAVEAESKAEETLKAAIETKEWFDTAEKVVGNVKALYEELDSFNKSHNAVVKGLDQLGPHAERNMELFGRYFNLSGTLLKKLSSLVPNEMVKSIADTTADILTQMGGLPRAGYSMMHGVHRGGKLDFGTGRNFYAISPFHENYKERGKWFLAVYGHDRLDRHYIVPPNESGWAKTVDDPESKVVILNQVQFDQFKIAASTLTTLKGSHLTQARFHRLAQAVKRGPGAEIDLDYKVWDSGVGLFKRPRLTPTFTVSELADTSGESQNGRRYLELEVGRFFVRHKNISNAVLPSEAAQFKIPYLLSLEENATNNKAHKLFLDYNLIWNHNEPMWEVVYGSPLSLNFFRELVKEKPNLGTGLTTGSELEKRLQENYDRIQAQPDPPKADILSVTANRTTWNELECEMVYQTSSLNTSDEVCRYFRIKVGNKEWIDHKPDFAEEWEDGARVRLNFSLGKKNGITYQDLQSGDITVEGVVAVKGEKQHGRPSDELPNPAKVVIPFGPLVKFDQFEVFPVPLKANAPVEFLLTAYIDDMFVPQQMPRVWFVLPHPKAKGGAFLVDAEPSDVRFLDSHTMVAEATLEKLPNFKKGELKKALAVIVFPGGYQFEHKIELSGEEDPDGRINIVTRRPKRYLDSTEILVTSERLAELDGQNDSRLHYTVYVSRAPNGPWLELSNQSFKSGHEITPETEGGKHRGNRLANNQVLLNDRSLKYKLEKNGWPQQPPFYYRVGEHQRTGSYSTQEVGEEIFSNVAGPKDSAVLLNSNHDQDEIHLKFRHWDTTTGFGLGPKNQNVDFQNAHIAVTDGVRTRHFWTPRFENGINYGASRRETRDNRAQVNLPFHGETTKLQVSGNFPGYSAERSLSFVLDDVAAALADREKELEFQLLERDKIIKRSEARIKDKTAELESIKKSIDYSTQWIRKLQSRAQPNQNDINSHKDTRLRKQRSLLLVEAQIKTSNRCDIPFAQQVFARREALSNFDFEKANETAKAIIEIERVRAKIELDRLTLSLPIEMAILDLPGNEFAQKREDVKKKYDRLIGDAKHGLELFMVNGRRPVSGSAFIEDAYRVGSLEDLKKRYQLRIDAHKYWAGTKPEKKAEHTQSIGALMMNYAGQFVELTADRQKAATIYQRGWELWQTGISGENAKTWDDLESLPSWWPSTGSQQSSEPE